MTERIFAVARKELIQLRRDPRSLTLAFGLPVLLVLLFGYAVSFDVKDIKLAILDEDRTSTSRELIDAFRETKVFRDLGAISRRADADRLLTKSKAQIVIIIPEGFAADVAVHRGGQIQALVDGADANTASISVSYAEATVGTWSQRQEAKLATVTGGVRPEIRAWYNETLDSRLAIVPGLIAVIMMVIAAMLTSLTIAREWERGTMEQLASTPVHPLEVIGGKLLPYLGIGMIDMGVTVLLGIFVFQVPFHGSLLLLFVTSLLFLLGGLGLGIFVSALVKSQLVATQMSMLITFLPGFLLSGFAFDIDNMPVVLQGVSLLVPARYFIVVTRGIFLKGVGIGVLWPPILALTLFALIGLTLAVKIFHKKLEP
ncbi:MAG TPA: ABC transporter permease [Gemmatimonadales bacterium]|nr:ABC transporter permease [Gemmatimonadales bacterium]